MTTAAAVVGVGIVGALLLGLSSRQKTTMEYGKLSSRRWQGSEYGGDIPRIYGTVGIEGSQIIWLEHNKLKEKVKKKKSGGKGGGGGTTTKTYTYFATFALMLCQGEISGVRRIWCGDKLIYNAGSDDLETIIASNQAAKGWKLYRGTDDQLPDPRYEADVGVGNAPAFRGYTYIVFNDFALADYSNTLQAAQFKVELVGESDFVGLRQIGKFAQPVTMNEASSIVMVKDNLISYAFDPGDTRPGYGDIAAYQTRTVRANDGIAVSQVKSPAYARPLLLSFNIPVGNVGSTTWCWHYTVNTAVIITATPSGLGTPVQYLPYAADSQTWLALSVTSGRVWIFRRRTTGAWYYEARDGAGSILETGGLLNADLSPYTGALYPNGFADADTVAVEEGGEAIWLKHTAFITSQIKYFARSGQDFILSDEVSDVDTSSNQYGMAAANGVCALVYRDQVVTVTRTPRVVAVKPALADVLRAECLLSSLIVDSDLNLSMLTQQINGYRVSGGTIRSIIEPLQGAYPFDFVPSGFELKAVPRGQSSVMNISWEDLAATDGQDVGDSLPYSREMDSQLPQKVTITALSSTREYGSSTHSSPGRPNTSAVNVEQREIPLVLADDEIAQMAEKLEMLRWLERDDFSFSLPPTYLALEPADVVTVNARFGTFELRLTEINYEADGRLTCKAKVNSAPLYTSRAVGAPGPGPDGTVTLDGPSMALLLDIPVVDEAVQNSPGYVGLMAGFTDSWPGGILVRSNDGGQTWADIQAFVGKPTIGTVATALPASNCTVIDYRAFSVLLASGELESVTRDQMLSGVNYAAYGVDGRWEIVRFMNAPLQSDGTYLVSGFVRGERGTEWATGLHQPGDYFVLLDDPDNAFIGAPVEVIGLSRLYRAVTSGASIDDSSDIEFTYRGVNLECLSPVYARGTRDGSSNFTGTFTRRSRLGSTWWLNGIQAPVGETAEAYEIDVMSGSTVKRTISVTSPAWSYSAADQTTDFGSVQAAITFRIFQKSETMGRGYSLEVTL
ncbi:phage tail protein [Pseudomonas nitroreducens]|uniref:phage tail protein n=1 Tax=Pseudomonas nitroreducens TaxID=46680 RepID=UPI00244A2526|nr:phage tail protein [Pseudomonas nitroreducens]MDG9855599.1 phage tail protein [Pseudomonas nitroreducens]